MSKSNHPEKSEHSVARSLRSAFNLMAEEDGTITIKTLRRVSQDMDLNYTDQEIKDMIEEADSSGKGRVTLNCLVHMIREYSEEFPSVNQETVQRELTSMSRGLTTIYDDNEELASEIKTEAGSSASVSVVGDTDVEGYEHCRGALRVNSARETDPQSCDSQVTMYSLDEGVVTLIKLYDEENAHAEHGVEKVRKNAKHGKGKQKKQTKTAVQKSKTKDNSSDSSIDDDSETEQALPTKSDSASTTTENTEIDNGMTECNNGGKHEPRISDKQRKHTKSRIHLASNSNKDDRMLKQKTINFDKARNISPVKQAPKTLQKGHSNMPNVSTSRTSTTRESPKNLIVPKRESPSVASRVGCSRMGMALKLSQLRVKQRLMYIMWRAMYDAALKKAETNRKAMVVAKTKKKRTRSLSRSKYK